MSDAMDIDTLDDSPPIRFRTILGDFIDFLADELDERGDADSIARFARYRAAIDYADSHDVIRYFVKHSWTHWDRIIAKDWHHYETTWNAKISANMQGRIAPLVDALFRALADDDFEDCMWEHLHALIRCSVHCIHEGFAEQPSELSLTPLVEQLSIDLRLDHGRAYDKAFD